MTLPSMQRRSWCYWLVSWIAGSQYSREGMLGRFPCAFGVEIYVIKPNNATFELLDLSKTIESHIFTWKIKDFSESKMLTILKSPEFIKWGRKWKLELYPNGYKNQAGKSLSCYLRLIDFESLSSEWWVYKRGVRQIKEKRVADVVEALIGVFFSVVM